MAPPPLIELEEDGQLAELVSNWKFEEGLKFQAKVVQATNQSVHHASSSKVGSFSLLAVFRRFTFRLSEASVSLAIHACLGGSPAGFHVTFIKDRHFKFEVSCKAVGFLICDLKRVITEHFDVYFHLWRDGGAQWIREEKQWLREEEQSWTKVSYQKKKKERSNVDHVKKVKFCEKIVQDSPVRKSNPRELPFSEINQPFKVGDFWCNLRNARSSSTADQTHGDTPRDGKQSDPCMLHQMRREVEDEFQIPCKKVFGTLKRALNINGKTAHKPLHSDDTSHQGTTRDKIDNCAHIIQWGVCFKCLSPSHHVRDCRGINIGQHVYTSDSFLLCMLPPGCW